LFRNGCVPFGNGVGMERTDLCVQSCQLDFPRLFFRNGQKWPLEDTLMTHDYLWGVFGGVLMGLGCTVLLLFNGRILGVSGLLGGALSPGSGNAWRRAFIGGMLVAGGAAMLFSPASFVIDFDRSFDANLLGAILVGAGTQLGSGCTSGHGICGIGRLSVRSLSATCTFMAGGALSVFVIQNLFGGGL